MIPPPDLPEKDALIAALLLRIEALVAAKGVLAARIAELESKRGQPPSKRRKPSEPSQAKDKAKPHAGRIARCIPIRRPGPALPGLNPRYEI
jgi:hypothetical protein